MSCSKSNPSGMKLAQNGLNVVKHFEGWFPRCYKDPVGIWTIGYGHACHVNSNDGSGCLSGNNCDTSITLTEAQGEAILAKDMAKFGECVQSEVKVPLTQNQFDALTSFAFNAGCSALRESTLLRKLNAGTLTPREAQKEFTKWTFGDGKCYSGLQRRRFIESELFNSCASSGAFSCDQRSCSPSQKYLQCETGCSYCSNSKCMSCTGNSATAPVSPTTAPVPPPVARPTPPPTNPPTEKITCESSEEFWGTLEELLDLEYLTAIRKRVGGIPCRLVLRRAYEGVDTVVVRAEMPKSLQERLSSASVLNVVPEFSSSALEEPAWVQMVLDIPRENVDPEILDEMSQDDAGVSAVAIGGIVSALVVFMVLAAALFMVRKRNSNVSSDPGLDGNNGGEKQFTRPRGGFSTRFASLRLPTWTPPSTSGGYFGSFRGGSPQSDDPSPQQPSFMNRLSSRFQRPTFAFSSAKSGPEQPKGFHGAVPAPERGYGHGHVAPYRAREPSF